MTKTATCLSAGQTKAINEYVKPTHENRSTIYHKCKPGSYPMEYAGVPLTFAPQSVTTHAY